MEKREDGYYWVKPGHGDWEVAEYLHTGGKSWFCTGDDEPYSDDAFIEIDERRIVRDETTA